MVICHRLHGKNRYRGPRLLKARVFATSLAASSGNPQLSRPILRQSVKRYLHTHMQILAHAEDNLHNQASRNLLYAGTTGNERELLSTQQLSRRQCLFSFSGRQPRYV